MPDTPIPDDDELFAAIDRDIDARRARAKLSMRFAIADLPAVDHGQLAHPLALGEHFSIETDGGDRLWLDDLFQYRTYGGVLNGVPSDPEHAIEDAIEYARSTFPRHTAPPCVLPPRLHRGHRKVKLHDGGEGLEHWRILPSCTSFGLFDTSRKARNADPDCDGSSVLLIWYQDRFGLPEDTHTLRAMAAVAWEEFAHGWSY